MNNVKMKDIPLMDRPIERLIRCGVESLSNEELLAILLRVGTSSISAKGLAALLLKKVGGIQNIKDVNLETLKEIPGIGTVKGVSILSLVELAKRMMQTQEHFLYQKLTSTDMVYKYYKNKLDGKMQEHFYAIYLDSQKRIIKEKLLFIGTLNYSVVHPRELFKEAFLVSAAYIVCMHNHPSGDVSPSKEDEILTRKLVEISSYIGIPIMDHIIIGKEQYYSFFENDALS
ncbi:MAG: DNA repair protein RadC [Bacilli bacterium]|nr:DNA repair protein RadC [Bacilli bacterium]